VVFARGKAVPADIVDLARQMNVPVFASRDTLFEAAGRLYADFGSGSAEPAARRRV
jgi:serine kinase of HPr protein (carbohydrate metabolism regulator)